MAIISELLVAFIAKLAFWLGSVIVALLVLARVLARTTLALTAAATESPSLESKSGLLSIATAAPSAIESISASESAVKLTEPVLMVKSTVSSNASVFEVMLFSA